MGRLFLLRCLILRWLLLLLLLGVALLALAGAARGGDGVPASQVLHLPAPGAIAETAPAGSLQFIGAATVLIQYQGLTILTDPNFLHKGEQSSGEFGVLAERLSNPAVELAAVPLKRRKKTIPRGMASRWHSPRWRLLVNYSVSQAQGAFISLSRLSALSTYFMFHKM